MVSRWGWVDAGAELMVDGGAEESDGNVGKTICGEGEREYGRGI
jgi:hypothetical protein